MNLIELSTRRRVTVAMMGVLMVVFGLISLSELKVNLLPDLSYPTLTVRTEFEGAAPIEIEKLISQPVEEQLGVVKGVTSIRSISRTGQSDVLLTFDWGTDMDLANLDVREKLELLQLPLTAKRPVLLRFNPSTDPVMRLAFFDESLNETFDEASLKIVRRFADEELKKRLEPIEGVAAVKISGGLVDEIQIDIDRDRLAQLGLSVSDLARRLREENVNLSGGRLEDGNQRYLVRTINQFQEVDEIRNLIISNGQGRPIYLGDLATVTQSYKEREAVIRTNGREAVEIAIYKEGDANTVFVADAVNDRLNRLKDNLPQSLKIAVVEDQSKFIRQAINEVTSAALFGGLLAILIIYFFLRDAMSTVIISVSIPLSVIACFFLMHQAGLSLNVMSLGGIALAVGLLVDNSIVVLENISRHRERNKEVIESAVDGASEVSGAVIASTLTTLAVFLPLIYVQGIGGQLFKDQALTVAFALAVSLPVALSFIPMLYSLKVRSPVAFDDEEVVRKEPKTKVGKGVRWVRLATFESFPTMVMRVFFVIFGLISKGLRYLLMIPARLVGLGFDLLAGIYKRVLPWALRHRFIVILVAGTALTFSVLQIPNLGAELIPQLAQGQVELKIKLPPGTPLESTDQIVRRIQQRAEDVPEIAEVFGVSGSGNRIDANPTESGENIGEILIVLEPGVGAAGEARAIAALRELTEKIPGASAKFGRPELFSFSTPLEIELVGYDLNQLKKSAEEVAAAISASSRFADVKSSLEAGHPEIQIRFDQERAAGLGLTVREVADELVRQIKGEVATRYSWQDRKIDVLVRSAEEDRSSLQDIQSIVINPRSDRPITLDSVATIESTVGPAEIHRLDQERAAVVSANLRYGTLKDAAAEANAILAEMKPPFGVKWSVAGQSEEMDASFKSLLFALGLAVFLVYLVMASQFESLIHPFVILLTIPLALVGAVASLIVTQTPISVIVFIGVIMLAGIVVNNAIVLVDLINQLRLKGYSRREAIIEAGQSRLRPIVMTTLTTTLGLLPLALGLGEGAEVRAPMAITVIGGLLVSTLLTLVVIPVVYDLMDRALSFKSSPQPATE